MRTLINSSFHLNTYTEGDLRCPQTDIVVIISNLSPLKTLPFAGPNKIVRGYIANNKSNYSNYAVLA